jgi:hypothetical protein
MRLIFLMIFMSILSPCHAQSIKLTYGLKFSSVSFQENESALQGNQQDPNLQNQVEAESGSVTAINALIEARILKGTTRSYDFFAEIPMLGTANGGFFRFGGGYSFYLGGSNAKVERSLGNDMVEIVPGRTYFITPFLSADYILYKTPSKLKTDLTFNLGTKLGIQSFMMESKRLFRYGVEIFRGTGFKANTIGFGAFLTTDYGL